MGSLRAILSFLRAFFVGRGALAAENVMLRQQLIVTHRAAPQAPPNGPDRAVLVLAVVVWMEVGFADCPA